MNRLEKVVFKEGNLSNPKGNKEPGGPISNKRTN